MTRLPQIPVSPTNRQVLDIVFALLSFLIKRPFLAIGAMSWAFIKTMKEFPGQSYVEILRRTRALLSQKYAQIPQLSVCLLVFYHFDFV
jgi:hypothetical protein